MNKSDFSIVIPWHKDIGNLRRAVASVLNQSMQPREIIIVCNGEGINHLESVTKDFSDSRFRILVSTAANANEARNVGISACTSRFCSFLDCDDEYTPSRISDALPILESRQDVIYSARGIRVRPSGSSWIFPRRTMYVGESLTDYILSAGNLLMTSSFSMETSTARKVMFDPDVTKFQDFDFLVRARSKGVSAFVDSKVGYVYHDEDSDKRLSSGSSFSKYVSWIEGYNYLDKRAKAAFLSRFIAQHEFPRNFGRNSYWLLRGVLVGGIPSSETALMIFKRLLPPRLRAKAYEMYFRMRHGK